MLDRTRLDGPFIVRAVLLLLLPPPSICMHASSGMEEALCLDRPATRFCSTEKARDSSLNTDWNYTEKRSKRDAYHQCKKKTRKHIIMYLQSKAEQSRRGRSTGKAEQEKKKKKHKVVHMDDDPRFLLYLQQRMCENRQGRDTCTAYYPMDACMHPIRSDHRPSAEVKDSAKPAGRAGMLPLLSSRLMTLPPPASASCQLFTICSSGRCRSMPR